MSNRTLVELNHDFCPKLDSAILQKWAQDMALYMRSADKTLLPQGVTFKHFRHHSEPDPLREAYAGEAKPVAPWTAYEENGFWYFCGIAPRNGEAKRFGPFAKDDVGHYLEKTKAGASPSDELVKVLTEARDFTETLLTHGDASISIAAKHIWASAERILKERA